MRNIAEHIVACMAGSAHMKFIATHVSAIERKKLQIMYSMPILQYISCTKSYPLKV